MAEHLVKIPCHIVFILKLYSKFLLGLFYCPAYLQLAPLPEELCSSGNAADYQWSIGIMGLSPLRGSLRAAPSKEETEVSLYPTFPSWQAAAPHGCLISLLIAHSGWRSWRQKISCFEKRGKIRSTGYSVFKVPGERRSASLFNTTLSYKEKLSPKRRKTPLKAV